MNEWNSHKTMKEGHCINSMSDVHDTCVRVKFSQMTTQQSQLHQLQVIPAPVTGSFKGATFQLFSGGILIPISQVRKLRLEGFKALWWGPHAAAVPAGVTSRLMAMHRIHISMDITSNHAMDKPQLAVPAPPFPPP